MDTIITVLTWKPTLAVTITRLLYRFSRNWWSVFNVLLGLYVGLPFLAPVFMKLGWTGAGEAIYLLYATQCHQLPQRSFFLFGPQTMYSLTEVQTAWHLTNNPAILRQFVGNSAMGWKVAWSDRMVSMYTSMFVAGLLYRLSHKWLKPLPLQVFALFVLPMAVDGGTHFISDIVGIGNGFRDGNAWLAALTGHLLPATFYAGDALGSFNSWARLVTGVLFGIGFVWLSYPYLNQYFVDLARELEEKFQKSHLQISDSRGK